MAVLSKYAQATEKLSETFNVIFRSPTTRFTYYIKNRFFLSLQKSVYTNIAVDDQEHTNNILINKTYSKTPIKIHVATR